MGNSWSKMLSEYCSPYGSREAAIILGDGSQLEGERQRERVSSKRRLERNGWSNKPNEGNRRLMMTMMMRKQTDKLFGNREMRILMLGLDAAGKTSESSVPVVHHD